MGSYNNRTGPDCIFLLSLNIYDNTLIIVLLTHVLHNCLNVNDK